MFLKVLIEIPHRLRLFPQKSSLYYEPRLVLTAHPTEAQRRSALKKHEDILGYLQPARAVVEGL